MNKRAQQPVCIAALRYLQMIKAQRVHHGDQRGHAGGQDIRAPGGKTGDAFTLIAGRGGNLSKQGFNRLTFQAHALDICAACLRGQYLRHGRACAAYQAERKTLGFALQGMQGLGDFGGNAERHGDIVGAVDGLALMQARRASCSE